MIRISLTFQPNISLTTPQRLYPAVSRLQPELAGKITGMMLEMSNEEVLVMLDNESQLRHKVDEAVRVLNQMK